MGPHGASRGEPGGHRLRFVGTLRARLILGTGVLLGAIAAFLVSYIPARLEAHALELTGRRAASIAQMTAHSVTAALVFEDQEAIEEVFSGARRNLDVLYLVLTGPTGEVVAAHNLPGAVEAAFERDERATVTADGQVLRVGAPVGSAHHQVGFLHLGLDLGDMHAYVAGTRHNVVLVTLLLFALGGLGFAGLSTVVTRPVRRIVHTMQGVSDGDLGLRTGLAPRDEIGTLGHSFDLMIARLEEAYGQLQGYNRELEVRVAERTTALRVEIEERERAEVALRERERLFRSMFESSVVGIALLDSNGSLLDTNVALRTMLGLSGGGGGVAARGGTDLDLLVHPDDRASWTGIWGPTPPALPEAPLEIRWNRPDGGLVWSRVVVSDVVQGMGAPHLGMVMVENVTDRRSLEEQLRQSQKLEAVGQLAGGVAHDFNNLLTTINGMTDLLSAEYAHLPGLVDDLWEIRKAGDHAASLTSQLLAFSRRQMLQPEELDPAQAVREMAGMLERLIGPTIRLDLDLHPDTAGVRADPGQLAQVIMNLVVNARDAMRGGGVLNIGTRNVDLDEIQANNAGARRPGRFVQIVVQDSGHGMDEATVARIFEPFFTTKPRGKGTGLGLSTVHGIVHQSGGGIRVDSTPGEGSTFTIVLPAIPRLSIVPAPEEDGEEGPAHKGLILLVEDEPAVRKVVGRFLRRSGYSVVEGVDGRHGIEVFHQYGGRIDAVVTDIIMPNMRGTEMVRRLAAEAPELPVLYISGYTEDESLAADLQNGRRCAFLQKPLAPQQISARLGELLDPGPQPSPDPGPAGPGSDPCSPASARSPAAPSPRRAELRRFTGHGGTPSAGESRGPRPTEIAPRAA